MMPPADPRRRRRAVLMAVVGLAAVTVVLVVLGVALQSWQIALLGAQLLLPAAFLVALRPGILTVQTGGRRRLARLHDVVRHVVPDDAGTTLIRLEGVSLVSWLGPRGLSAPFVVLVDDEAGFSLWTERRGSAEEVVRWRWSDVREAIARDDGFGVELRMVDPAERTPIAIPVAATGSATVDRMHSPSRNHELAARLGRRIVAANPDAPSSDPRRSGDVDWLG